MLYLARRIDVDLVKQARHLTTDDGVAVPDSEVSAPVCKVSMPISEG
ncbi:hypothetical protein [Lysobacter terrae]